MDSRKRKQVQTKEVYSDEDKYLWGSLLLGSG